MKNLDLAHRVLAKFLAEKGVSAELADCVTLAMSEGATNAIRHAGGGMVGLECRMTAEGLMIVITDAGPGFDLNGVPLPDFEVPREGGYGVHIMRTVMDGVTYERREGRNVLTLIKRLDASGQGAS